MKIALDVDGVVCNLYEEIYYRLERDGYDPIPHEKLHSFKIEDNVNSLSKEWIKEQFRDNTFWLNTKPFQDAWLMINKWFMSGHDVYLVTCRWSNTLDPTLRWLSEWDIPFNDISMGNVHLEKYKFLERVGADLMVEDRLDEANEVAKRGITSFLIDKPYNQGKTKAKRIKNLYEVDEIING